MNDITVFNNKEFGKVREITINGEPWFVGKDVAEALGYENINKAVQMHVYDEDKKVLDFKGFSQNGTTQKLWSGNDFSKKTIINESGMYALIFGSKLESAKRFKRWVTHDVIPSIRKTGSYSTNKNEQGINDHLLEIVNLQQDEINRLKKTHRDAAFANPFKISALHHVLCDNGYNISHVKLCKRLRDEGYLKYHFANGRNYNVPTTKSLDLGIMYKDQSVYQGSFVIPVTYITVKGQKYFIDLYCTPHEAIATDMKPMQFCKDLHRRGYSKRPLELMQWMRDNGYLKRDGHVNIATEKSLEMGLMKDNVTRSGNFENHHTIVTGEGQKFFSVLLM